MRRTLLFTITVLTAINFLPFATVQTQLPEKDQLPDIERDYPKAGENCKDPRTLAPFVSHLDVAPQKSRCYLTVANCKTGNVDEYWSAPRPSGTVDLDCSAYEKAFEELKIRTICCDKEACAPPTPWFDRSACKEPKSPLITISGGTATLTMCGYPVFYDPTVGQDDLFNDAYRSGVRDYLAALGLDKVCCDKFNDAVRTGQPCDPSKDVDCDGQPNKSDIQPGLGGRPLIEGPFSVAPDVERGFPEGITADVIMPPERCEDCKWLLTKGELKCNPDKTKGHSYEATWRCPITGRVVTVKKLSKPGVYVGCP